jgi:hypothetical protein
MAKAGALKGVADVRFGSKADICGALADVCFVPIADIRPWSLHPP